MINGEALGKHLRCAIYTRKSTEEGLEQAFNTLQAQREAAEAYIHSQKQNGWIIASERFDDGGFSGANLERPALQRLLSAIEARQVDCVVVYKVDRLSRSLLDFARLMERFDRGGISFVSVTQDFNTTTSLGRLTLNILLSFAQFEREIISERTRDKLSAARRKGKWIGGWQMLGYDLDAKAGKLVVNAREAAQVREIFEIARQAESLEAAVREVQARDLKTKAWSTKKGKRHPACRFHRTMLRRLLFNPLYVGCVRHRGAIYAGEQERIVEPELFEQVMAKFLERGQQQRGRKHQQRTDPLASLLHCGICHSGMVATFTTRHGHRYRYYGCRAAKREDRKKEQGRCDQGFVAAADLEGSILEKLQPVLGAGLNWATVNEAVERIEYRWESHAVAIYLKEGTRLDYQMPVPNRPGVPGAGSQAGRGRVPRVSRLVALAIKFKTLIAGGTIRKYRDLAEAGRVTRARLSQIVRLTELAPSIQEELLFLPRTLEGPDRITEKGLRGVAESLDWAVQKQRFAKLKAGLTLK